MQFKSIRPVLMAAVVVAGSGILAGGLALGPAHAAGNQSQVNPMSVTNCNSGNPCKTFSNSGIGAGVKGSNTNSSPFSSGVIGSSTKNGNGVSGFGVNGFGVNGVSSSSTGVSGSSSSAWGTFGYSTNGIGAEGQSVNNIGVEAFSSGPSEGLLAASGSGDAIVAISESSATAVAALGGTGDAIDATTFGGIGIYANNGNGNGGDIRGTYIGSMGRAPAGTGGFPLVATDLNGNDLMFVNGNGDLFYHGGLSNFSKTRDGKIAVGFGTTTTSPTVEDNGTARLVGGVATVQLDPTFANSIDMSKAYQVMLTPDGDTKGLYIASKSPTGFVVRETQAGNGTLNFDYHIYAPALGQAGKRMAEMTTTQAQAFMPHAQAFTRPVPKVNISVRPH
ncbi:MAG TPA: hypothetical protein VII69_11195 [Candidatus Eremiobacteraceae bacterium]